SAAWAPKIRRGLFGRASGHLSRVADQKAADMPAPTRARTTGVQPTPKPAITSPIAPGPAMPPTDTAGNNHEVARESPGRSLASHTMPVGKIGASASPAAM